ncbi:hypothetical protein M153_9100002170 [Pseudoloma neurophilia]|uniref:Uncharacterized protein n=1 Tax=Pseudoloma neurophilia TaxID=146866 RepID=A0A0R0LVW4_9MICR|nr:hypothetical protein M153_9100002170 [Pseudoloma neurophilia]
MPQMTDSDYSATKATDHRRKNLSKTNNKVPYLKSVFVRHALGMQIPHEQDKHELKKLYRTQEISRENLDYECFFHYDKR